jgi:RND superfamily putative drug exporter
MVAVFAAFAAGELVMLQQVGFGLAVAIILDATIVRTVLVPATMQLLGRRNWYLPRWLAWLPTIGAEESEPVTGEPLSGERRAATTAAGVGGTRGADQEPAAAAAPPAAPQPSVASKR